MKKNALNILIFLLLLLIIGIVVYLNVHNKPKPVGSISLDKDVLNIYVGESVKINVLISSDTEGNNYLKWESDNNEIATVTDDGLVTGQGIGSTLVSVYSSNSGMRVKCLVKVKEIPVASNEPTPTITMMPTPTIKPTVVPTPTITVKPTVKPTLTPTVKPTLTPTIKPTVVPTPTITVKPTVKPTLTPTIKPTVTPTVKPTPIPIPEYIVKYYDTNEIKSETKKLNDTLGILPTVTKSGYTFLGWYTNSTGGNKVSSTTKVTANMTLYAHWEKAVVVLPDTFVAPSGYDEVIGKSYISDTLKYRTFKANSSNRYYSLIWVKNAYQQLNTANKDFNGGTRTDMLNYEIKAMSYQSKGMIATNGSFSYRRRSNTPAIISKGNLLVNDKYNRADNYYYSTVTLTKDGTFATYKTRNADELINWFTKVGARNSWNTTHFNDSDWNGGRSDGANHRTAICQIDKNNYVLYAGYSTGIQDYMKELHDVFGCKVVMNLDGGGSTGMYYKTMSMSNIGTVYEYHRSGESCPGSKCRTVGDMLYFVE